METIAGANEGLRPLSVNAVQGKAKLPADSMDYFDYLMSKLAERPHRVFETDEEWGNQLEED